MYGMRRVPGAFVHLAYSTMSQKRKANEEPEGSELPALKRFQEMLSDKKNEFIKAMDAAMDEANEKEQLDVQRRLYSTLVGLSTLHEADERQRKLENNLYSLASVCVDMGEGWEREAVAHARRSWEIAKERGSEDVHVCASLLCLALVKLEKYDDFVDVLKTIPPEKGTTCLGDALVIVEKEAVKASDPFYEAAQYGVRFFQPNSEHIRYVTALSNLAVCHYERNENLDSVLDFERIAHATYISQKHCEWKSAAVVREEVRSFKKVKDSAKVAAQMEADAAKAMTVSQLPFIFEKVREKDCGLVENSLVRNIKDFL